MAVRGVVLAVLASFVVAVATPGVASSSTSRPQAGLSTLESGVLDQLNLIRSQHALAPLTLNGQLTAAAAQHSHEMASHGYFQHASADGTIFWKRIQHWYGSSGYGYWSVGENLLWASPDIDPLGALKLWMHSPEHRRNILNSAWREIGVSAVHVASAPGTYGGRSVTVITTDFGTRK